MQNSKRGVNPLGKTPPSETQECAFIDHVLTQHWQDGSGGWQGSDQPSTGAATAAGSADKATSTALGSGGDPAHLPMGQVLVPRLARAAQAPEGA